MNTYEENITKLEEILQTLNSEVPLEQAVKLYEKAQVLIEASNKQLKSAETRITKVTESINGTLNVQDMSLQESSQHEVMTSDN